MTINYALTRGEIVRVFFVGLGTSSRIRAVVLLLALLPAFVSIGTKVVLTRTVLTSDVIIALAWTLGMFCLVIALVFVRGKTAERTLVASELGISTQIGSINAQLPWTKVKEIKDSGSYILIIGKSGNSFFVPLRAFSSLDKRNEFLTDLVRWHRSAQSS